MRFFQRHLPKPEALQNNRWLRWLGPRLLNPQLWHFSRRGVALGVALGMFFGLLVPLAQIPLAAGAAVVLRANLPAAVASTLVTNPLTFPPVYYAAWKLGSTIIGTPAEGSPPPLAARNEGAAAASAPGAADGFWRRSVAQVQGVGKPLLVGLPLLACATGLAVYFAVTWGWAARVYWARQRRRRAMVTSSPHSSRRR
jgi:uncharacterized protein (DUF2062 family)